MQDSNGASGTARAVFPAKTEVSRIGTTIPAGVLSPGTVRPQQFGNSFLDSIPEKIRHKLAPYLREIVLTKNTYLVQQDEAPEWVYFPVKAVISRYQILEDGRTIEVALTGSEGAVGLASTLGRLRSISCCQVCIGGKAFKIYNTYLGQIFRTEPQLGQQIVEVMEAQIKQISKRLVCSNFHSVEQRLCAWLLLLNARCGGDRIEVTHDQTARSLGIHRPTVTAITKSLRDRGMITYARGRITISDPSGMEKLACDCYLDFVGSGEAAARAAKA